MSSEHYTFLYEKLLNKKALDVFSTPIFMKKNRPAYKLTAICKKENKEEIEEILFKDTSTFGIRSTKMTRNILERDFDKVITSYGDVTTKRGYYKGKHIKTSFEFEDVKKLAIENKVSLKNIEDECMREINKL